MIEFFQPKYQPKPTFEVNKSSDQPTATITLKGVSGILTILQDKLCLMLCWGLMCLGLYRCYLTEVSQWWLWVSAIIVPWLLYPLLHMTLSWLLAQRKTLTLDHQALRYRRLWPKTLKRDMPLTFELFPHKLAAWEKQYHEHKQKKDQEQQRVRYRKQYFQVSFHIVAVRHHQAHPLMTVYSERQANRCLAVLYAA